MPSSSSSLTLPFPASVSASVLPLLTSPLTLPLSSQEEKEKMVIIPPLSHLSIISTSTSKSTSTTKIMKKASIYNCYKNRNNRNNIHLRRSCNFSSMSSSSSSSNNNDSEAALSPGTTLDRLWKESTNRILKFDEKAKPIEKTKMNSLQWQLIETLILYWSTTTSTSKSTTRSSSSQSLQSSTTTFSSSTMSNNVDISLQLINRLAEERMAHIGSTDTTDTTFVIVDTDDFRTIDISLIHAMLKQWKECIQNQRRMDIHYNTNTNSNTNNSHRKRNNNKNQQQQESESEKSIFKLIPSPFEMLQKIDYWNKTLSLVEPNIVTYTIIMDVSAITGSSSSGKNGDDFDNFTENLLYRLMEECQTNQKLQPTIVTIGTVIHSLANTKTLVGAQKAENWLRYLQTQQQQQQESNTIGRRGAIVLKPNTIIYTTVMKAYADVGQVHKSEELLREMYTEYTIHHNQDVKPTLFTFNTVLGSYSKSKFEFENIDNAIQKSEELIQRMKDLSSKSKNITTSTSTSTSSHLLLDVTPDIVSYNSVLSIIARRCSKSKIYRQRQQQREQQQQRKKVSLKSSHSNIDTEDDVDDSLLLLQLLSKAEYWMEEILGNSSLNTNNNNNNNNNNNEIVMPNQITYKILFNIIASMTSINTSKTTTTTTTTSSSSSSNDKKEKAKQWLLRSNNTKLINDPILLKQINTM
jgi:pentatricopeptide repeat protein